MRYIKAKAVKDWAKEHRKQVSKDFLESLDRLVEKILISSIQTLGHHRRLTPELLPKK